MKEDTKNAKLVPQAGRKIRLSNPTFDKTIIGLPVESGDVIDVVEHKESISGSDILVFETEDGKRFSQYINTVKLWRDNPIRIHAENSQGADQYFDWEYVNE